MRTTTMTLLISIVPTLLAAQSPAADPSPTQGLSAHGRVQAEATLQAAHDQGLPEQPLHAVMLEGQAKGATEAQVLAAEQQALARLEAAQQVMVQAGRSEPSDAEVTRGASLLAQGMTSAELGAMVALGQTGMESTVAITSGVGAVSADASASAAVDLSAGGSGGALSAVGSTGATAGVSGGVLGR